MKGAPRVTVDALNKDEQHGKHKVNTTKINRNRVLTQESNPRPLTCRERVLPLHHKDIYVFSCIILL